jgi:thioredoxin-like negative regulator of GroEL
MTGKTETAPPDALLLMGKRCPYCPTVLKGLQALETSGEIGRLETAVIEDNPELAAELGVRSVPWVRIGPFELPGLRSEQELREWAQKAGSPAGMASYLDELLSAGSLEKGQQLVRDDPNAIHALLELLSNPDTQLNTRIGISAIMEELAGSEQLQGIIEQLDELTRHKEASIRGDACYFLALSGDNRATGFIKPLLEDPDADVREIAQDSLQQLANPKV